MSEQIITIALEGPCATVATEAEVRAVALHTLAAEGLTRPVAISIVLVDDQTIHELNRQFLAHDEPTDIITFPLADADDAGFGGLVRPGPQELGELYISCERAAAQSVEWGSTPEREVLFLVIHGVLHLLGWDDATAEERAQMLARQDAILADWETVARRMG